jgi:hypothetical protein
MVPEVQVENVSGPLMVGVVLNQTLCPTGKSPTQMTG